MGTEPVKAGEFRLEVVVIPVTDVDRAKAFYESLGWRVDADLTKEETYRIVQVTPLQLLCQPAGGVFSVTKHNPPPAWGRLVSTPPPPRAGAQRTRFLAPPHH